MLGVRSRVCHATRPAGFGAPVSPAGARRRSSFSQPQPSWRPWQMVDRYSKPSITAVGWVPLYPPCTPSAWSGLLKHSITSLRIPRRSDTFCFVRSATDAVQQSKSKCHSNYISHFMCPFHQTIHTRDPDIESVGGRIVPKFSHCSPFRDDHGVTACHAA